MTALFPAFFVSAGSQSAGAPQPAVSVECERPSHVAARDLLLDRAMGPHWRRKSSEKLRRGRLPSEGLAFVACDAAGKVVGTVRLWDIRLGERGGSALLLGPLAVDPSCKAAGIGSALMRHALAEAKRLDHGSVLLVGDPEYYGRFGFSAEKTAALAMPGPYEMRRFLGIELIDGALDDACGTLRPAGRRIAREPGMRAA